MFGIKGTTARLAVEGTGQEHAIIFVHGLGGNPSKTWMKMIGLMNEDPAFFRCTLDCYGYPTRHLHFPWLPWLAPPPGLPEIAEGLKAFLLDRYAGYARIDLVAHSLGGIIVRKFLVSDSEGGFSFPIKKVALIAVPNSGSSLASVAKQVGLAHPQLQTICRNSEDVTELDAAWRTNRIEQRLSVRYMLGGIDRCVSRESSCTDPNAQSSMIVGADHRNIINPVNREDNRYTILTRFLQAKGSDRITNLRAPDPLFDIYTPEQEQYYLERPVDEILSRAISAGNIWLSGKSGVGKSAALRRVTFRNGWTLSHINLSAYEDTSPVGMICALADELAALEAPAPTRLPERSFEAACRSIRTSLGSLCGQDCRAFVVEEIPLGANAIPEFLDLISRLLQMLGVAEQLHSNAVFAFSSIIDISKIGTPIAGKVQENIQIVTDPDWTEPQIRKLVIMLNHELKQSLQQNEVDAIVAVAQGLPRFVKLFFRQLRNGIPEGMSLDHLLTRIASELV